MKVSEAVVKILEKEGIMDAFGIPGAGINPVYEYLQSSKIKHYLMRHEAACVHAADGYYRSSGKLALAICTSGPGATNFITGLYTANIDSMPLIAITGQAKVNQLETDAFQCVDIVEIAKTITKKSFCVLDPKLIPEIFQQAIYLAKEGRPGPVLIDLPIDVQMADIDFDIDEYKSKPITKLAPQESKIKEALSLLKKANSPLIIMGGGVVKAQAESKLIELAEYLQIPVITTYMAKGGIPETHPLNAGQVGIQVGANSSGNKIFLDSDIIMGVGCRFTDRHTGNLEIYKKNRKFIHIDVDKKEIGKLIDVEVGIHADALLAIESLLNEAKKTSKAIATDKVLNIPALKAQAERKSTFTKKEIDPRDTFLIMNEVFNDEVLYTTGCGLNQIWSGQYLKINKTRKYLPSGGAGTLGFDIPAAFGASIGVENKTCVCVMGDFGFTFMVEELAVAAKYQIPIIVIVLNNSYLSLIRQNQKYAYKYEYEVAMPENKTIIDYQQVSKGFGCCAVRVEKIDDLKNALKKAYDSKKPYVVEIIVENETDCDMGNDIINVKCFS